MAFKAPEEKPNRGSADVKAVPSDHMVIDGLLDVLTYIDRII